MRGIFDVKVNLPAEFKAAVKDLPEYSRVADRFSTAMEGTNITLATVALVVVFGAITAVLLAARSGK